MDIYVGGNRINDIKIGSTAINSVWIGAHQVWSRTLVLPESGWNNLSGTVSGGQSLSNTVTFTHSATITVTISSTGSNGIYNSVQAQVNTGSGWPVTGGGSARWGHNRSAFGTALSFTVNGGDQMRFEYFVSVSGSSINTTGVVMEGSDTVDTGFTCSISVPSGGSTGACFLAESMVMLEDLTSKRIADMQPGDMVIGDGGVINEVVQLRVHDQMERTIFNINNLQTTESHPIKTSEGWKAISPESAMVIHPEMTITQLAVGDSLTRVSAQGVEYADEVTSITSESMDVQVYNLNVSGSDTPGINGNDTYVVDNVVVHNK